MNIYIPRIYNLHISEFIRNDEIIDKMNIDNFIINIDKQGYIYKISSNIKLVYLLDFLYTYENLFIKKIYYYLIIKYLLSLNNSIKKSNWLYKCIYNDCIYDKLIKTRQIYISNNNDIIITSNINYNICLIIVNKTLNKSLIAIIDNNTDISNLDELLRDIYNDDRYENIEIYIIGGNIDIIDKIINIYIILKKLKLSKFIIRTNIIYHKKPLKRIKYNMFKNSIKMIDMSILWESDVNLDNYISYLHKI